LKYLSDDDITEVESELKIIYPTARSSRSRSNTVIHDNNTAIHDKNNSKKIVNDIDQFTKELGIDHLLF